MGGLTFYILLHFGCLICLSVVTGFPNSRYDRDVHHPRPLVRNGDTKPSSGVDWNKLARDELDVAKFNLPQGGTAKNVILFVGDGLGMSTITAARRYMAETRNVPFGARATLSFEDFPGLGLSMVWFRTARNIWQTYNSDRWVADSSGAATAMLCGEKANFYTVGVSDAVTLSDCTNVNDDTKLKSAIKHAIDAGKLTGVVSNARITHATPAAAYASVADRNWEAAVSDDPPPPGQDNCKDIAHQLVHDNYADRIKVYLGGGQQSFYPEGDPDRYGKRKDGRNLIEEWIDKKTESAGNGKFRYIETRQEMLNTDIDETEYLLGLFSSSHMSDEIDRLKEKPTLQPSLAEMVETAIQMLQKGPDGFFLFVEGAKIDMAHHDNLPHRALNETLMFSDAIQKALDMTDQQETLVVVTGDHSHVFNIAGYPKTTESIFATHLDMQWEPDDRIPYTVLSYVNGPGWYEHRLDEEGNAIVRNVSGIRPLITRKNLTGVDTADVDYVSDAGIPNAAETHAGEEVPIYSIGPSSYIFNGLHEQHFIAHGIMYATCIGPYANDCQKPDVGGSTGKTASSLTFIGAAISWLTIQLMA